MEDAEAVHASVLERVREEAAQAEAHAAVALDALVHNHSTGAATITQRRPLMMKKTKCSRKTMPYRLASGRVYERPVGGLWIVLLEPTFVMDIFSHC